MLPAFPLLLNINLYKLLGQTKEKFTKEINGLILFEESRDKIVRRASSELNYILDSLKNIENYKTEERELLLDYRDYIIDLAQLSVSKEEFPQIFKSERAYNFYIKTLKYFEAIDDKLALKRGGQKIINAIRKSDLYKKHILFQPLTLKDYVEELNLIFRSDMSTTNLTDEDYNQRKEVDDYLEENYDF